MKELERQYKALANRRRLHILQYLKKQHQASVGEIATEIHLTLKATSKHLGILSGVDALEKEQKGLVVFYRLSKTQRPVLKHFLVLV